MKTVFFINLTVYGNDFTDNEIVLATLDEEFANSELARMKTAPKVRDNGYAYEYTLDRVTLSENVCLNCGNPWNSWNDDTQADMCATCGKRR